MKKRYWRTLAFVLVLSVIYSFPGFGMDAPGNGDPRWVYSQKDYHWYFYEEEEPYTGWLKFEGEWYWFDEEGRMANGGFLDVGGVRYYFFVNGHMAHEQFVSMKYYDENGQDDPDHDVRKFGKTAITGEQRDLFSDYLYEIPRSWIARFMEEGWQMMFYTSRKYFSAPDTNQGIYYVYHSVDTHYKKLKFTDVEAVQQAFGEYVGYSAGLYKNGNVLMEQLWKDEPALAGLLEIPDYYASDAKFYFGRLFAAYLDEGKKEEIWQMSPESGEILEDILWINEDEETRNLRKQRLTAQLEQQRQRRELGIGEYAYGPGVPKAEKSREEQGAEKVEPEESGAE